MFSRVYSGGLSGMEGYVVQVEADVSPGLPSFHMVGYLASEVKEAEERVRTGIRNSGFRLPSMRVTVNLSPANVRKDGTGCDLPVAVAVLASYGVVEPTLLRDSAFLGELGLDGRIKPVRGVLSMVLAMRQAGMRRCFLAEENISEGLAVEQIEIIKVSSIGSLVELLNCPEQIKTSIRETEAIEESVYAVDFSEVNGQKLVRRATEVAGSGKSMIARRIPTIMPELTQAEQLEVSQVYSICGLLPQGRALMRERPFRAPHHTISAQALTGGGMIPRPGEISLASRGVLFLDELPEFEKKTLEILRQPMEDRKVTVARVQGTYEFPAHFMLAAALNPCPCGYYPDRQRCTCSELQVRKYLGKISRPLLDRIDLCVEAAPVSYQEIRRQEINESSAVIRERVEKARRIQEKRFAGMGIIFNSEMGNREIRQFCRLGDQEETFLQMVFQRLGLSARGCQKLLRVARTIADLDGQEQIQKRHLIEAVGYRDLEERYWGREES